MQIVLTEADFREAIVAHVTKLISNKYMDEVEIILPETTPVAIIMTNGPGGPLASAKPADKAPVKKAATKKAASKPKVSTEAKSEPAEKIKLPANELGDNVVSADDVDAPDTSEADAVAAEMEGKTVGATEKRSPTKKRMFGNPKS